MILLVRVRFLTTEEGGRKTPIASGYRPDWVSDRKPEYNCAQLLLPQGSPSLQLGAEMGAVLQPLRPELWHVERDDELKAMEGAKHVASAVVLEVFGKGSTL